MKIQKPNLWAIVIIDDDFTPRDFIVQLLEQEFGHTEEWVETLFDDFKQIGKSICGIYSKDVALSKLEIIKNWPNHEGFPLKIDVEEIIEIECK